MDSEPPNYLSLVLLANLNIYNNSLELIGLFILLLILIISSALISGSEIAFFSLSPKDIESLEESDSKSSANIINLKKKPKTLLATILIANNFINIAIVIVSDYFIKIMLGEERLLYWGDKVVDIFGIHRISSLEIGNAINFLITVVGVTFILVLFGEVIPKIYANVNNLQFSTFMARPLNFLNRRFSFLSKILVESTDAVEKRLATKISGRSISREHIDKAIELTVEKTIKNKDELDILKGIVKFNEVIVKEIMKPRIDITAVEINTQFKELLAIIKSSGYSRIPVYKEDFDTVVGILYVKDLIGKKDKSSFDWQSIIREDVLYTPETKKINDQLKEFQLKKVHIAIVVDEYGGSAGLITLEDIMEEIIGDISDEFDQNRSVDFVKISDHNYIFDGKSSIHDVAKIIHIDSDIFDEYKGDADSIAGLLLEINGLLPKEQSEFKIQNLKLIASKVTDRRIVKVQVKILKD